MINNRIKFTLKFIFLVLLLSAGASFALFKHSKQQKTNSINLQGNTVESMVFLENNEPNTILPWNSQDGHEAVCTFYQKELIKHEDALWQEAQKTFGITKESFQKRLTDYRYTFNNKNAKRSPKLSPSTITMVEEVITQCGLNPKTIEIMDDSKMIGSPAMANHKTIFINEKSFKKYSPEGVRFIIAHETMHIKHQDGMAHGVLDFLLEEKQTPKDQQKQFVNKFLRFQETRADIHAVLLHKEIAQGGISFFTDLDKMFECGTKRHPRNSDRLDMCTTVSLVWDNLAQGIQHA